jgi:hypothetical protein
MEQLTLERAIDKFTNHIEDENSQLVAQTFFKEGAEWQKEQLKAKWEAMSNLMENGLAKDLVDRVAAQLLQD